MNNFDVNIQFTYETKTQCKLLFLDVLFHRKGSKVMTIVSRISTNDGMYLTQPIMACV